jgi:hypothetical protein
MIQKFPLHWHPLILASDGERIAAVPLSMRWATSLDDVTETERLKTAHQETLWKRGCPAFPLWDQNSFIGTMLIQNLLSKTSRMCGALNHTLAYLHHCSLSPKLERA